MFDIRTGFGVDFHRFCEGRPLILCGVEIPFEKGLLGHSDADVMLHALCDALLGAACLGDIGVHFPPSDPKYKGISSLVLLKDVVEKVYSLGYSISNIDMTLVAQRPKISNYKNDMKKKISDTCDIPPERINIKATTTEGMGFVGREEGIMAYCVVTLIKPLKDLS